MDFKLIIEKVKNTIGKLPFSKMCENSSVSILKDAAPFANYVVAVIGVVFVINVVATPSSSGSVNGKKVTVQAKDAAYTIKSLEKNTNLIVTDYIDNKILEEIASAVYSLDKKYGGREDNDGKIIPPRLKLSLDFSKTTGEPFKYEVTMPYGVVTNLILPPHIDSIDGGFLNCDKGEYASLESISISSKNKYFKSVDGVLYTKDGTELVSYPPAKKGSSFSIPNGVETIGESAFRGCRNLSEIKPSKTVIHFEERSFWWCPNLKSFEIPSGCTTIPDYAFTCCYSLEKVTIPASVERIGIDAFSKCPALKKVIFGGAKEQWNYMSGTGNVPGEVTFMKKAADVFPAAKFTSDREISDGEETINYWRTWESSSYGGTKLNFESDGTFKARRTVYATTFEITGTYTVAGSTLTFNCKEKKHDYGYGRNTEPYEKTISCTVRIMRFGTFRVGTYVKIPLSEKQGNSGEYNFYQILLTDPTDEEVKAFYCRR